MLLYVRPSFSQDCIHGTVRDENNEAIPFAAVTGLSGKGTVCDSSGRFELCFPAGSVHTVVIRSVGYITDTVTVSPGQRSIVIGLVQKKYALRQAEVVHIQTIKDKSMVSVISPDKREMALLNPQNVNEVLQTKTGFTNRKGYQTPITLRGMSGKRLLVLRNGLRRFSSYPAGFMSHIINVYDLERIEVEKGAASVIYGAGAMAGIINLIDKSPFKQKGLNAKLTTGYGTVNRGTSLLACGGWSNGKLAVKTGLRYRSAGNYKYPDGATAANSFYKDKDAFLSAGYQFSDNHTLVFTADFHDGGPWGKPLGFNGSDYMRVRTEDEKSDNYALQYTYKQSKVLRSLEVNAFFSKENRELIKNYYTAAGYTLSYTETTRFSDFYYGTRLSAQLFISKKYTINTGTELYSFHISTPTDAVDYIQGLSFENRVSHDAHSDISGIFLQNNFILCQRVRLVAGFRYDHAMVNEGDVYSSRQDEAMQQTKKAVSGNIAASVRVNRHSRFRLNIARSFRMPETAELYADSYTPNGILYANPGLEPEYCYSIDACYTYTPGFIDIEISPFIWLMDDMISKEEVRGLPGTNYQFTNIGKAQLWGGEAVASLPVKGLFSNNDKLSVMAGAAYLNGTEVTGNNDFFGHGIPLDYVPPFNLKSDISYSSKCLKSVEYDLAVRTIYYTEQTRLGESHFATPAYLVLGCTVCLSFPGIKTKPSLNITVNNLLNNEYYSYQSYLPDEGRDFRFFLTFHFN